MTEALARGKTVLFERKKNPGVEGLIREACCKKMGCPQPNPDKRKPHSSHRILVPKKAFLHRSDPI